MPTVKPRTHDAVAVHRVVSGGGHSSSPVPHPKKRNLKREIKCYPMSNLITQVYNEPD